MTKTLHLFVDTNLFIQCRYLSELDWSEWKDFSEVHLIVSLPVQREIDRQKTRGNDRVGRRARSTYSSLFRAIATGEKEFELIHDVEPRVKLFLESPSRPDPELADSLDYSRPDDEIIGCLSRFVKDNPGFDVRLLTHDTGPLMTARGLGLSVAPIGDEWLISPENNNDEREIARLRQEIAQLKKAEPQFDIRCVDSNGAEIDELELTHRIYRPLSDDDICHYLDLLEGRFPIETEFNRQELMPPSLTTMGILGRRTHFVPSSEEDIKRYREQKYPEWLEDCREWLTDFHEALQRKDGLPNFRFEAANVGSRPGRDALVVITANGNFTICPPPYEEEELEEPERTDLSVPSPPAPPHGKWRVSPSPIERMMQSINTFNRYPDLAVARYPYTRPHRDRNAFYYKPTRITEPSDAFSLECEQWRHGTGSQSFLGDISVKEDVTKVSGTLECEIHAENLSQPSLKRIPVRIKVEYPSSREAVEELIDPPLDKIFRL